MNKVNAPNILLEDFNLFLNKAINQYVNKRYNIYDINQQVTDDLSVLKGTAIYDQSIREEDEEENEEIGPKFYSLKESDVYRTSEPKKNYSNIYKGIYQIKLPKDYFHILNCVCTFIVTEPYRCYDVDDIFEIGATKLTADTWNQVVNNFWNKPTYRRPYYYIHYGDQIVEQERKNADRIENDRSGGSQKILCEVRVGTDKHTVFKLSRITIDYLKVPKFYRLTQSQIDMIRDTSDVLEFPDYVCWEIINELVHIIMENISDQRLQTHPVVSQSIANPAQAQAQADGSAQ